MAGMIHFLHNYLETRRLKRELAVFAKQFEANLQARKQARERGQTYVSGHLRRRGTA